MDQQTPTTGSKYRYIRDIADGGMGTVQLAAREEGTFRRVYAIKRLKKEHQDDPRIRAMFLEEARLAGMLHHPNVVSVVDLGEDESGPYLVMDYVQGVALSELINDARRRGELIPAQICMRIIKQVAEGLDAAHELVGRDGQKLELVHRDVSPQNVLLGYDGVARLSDFGIAKALGRTDKTNTGILKGKFGYFSPEQLRFHDPTRRSDIFSLGVVLFELLSANRLYGGDNAQRSARRILEEPAPDIDDVRSDVHPTVVKLMIEMLAKDPERRPTTAQEVALHLDAALLEVASKEGPMSIARYLDGRFSDERERQALELEAITGRMSLVPISSHPRRSHRRALVIATVGLIVASLAGVWTMMNGTDANPKEPTTLAEAPAVAGTPTSPTPVVVTTQEVPRATEQKTDASEDEKILADAKTVRQPARARKATRKPKARSTPKPAPTKRPAKRTGVSAEDAMMGWNE